MRRKRRTGHAVNATLGRGQGWKLLAWVACSLVAITVAFTGGIGAVDEAQLERHFSVRGAQTEERIVFVAIDERTQDELRERFPFPRRLHAQLVDRLEQAGVRQTILDLEFDAETTPEDDGALLDAVAAAENVTVAANRIADDGEVATFGGRATLADIGAAYGSAQIPVEPGGVVRDLALEIRGIDTLPVAAARQLGIQIPEGRFDDNRALMDMAGGPGAIPRVSYVDVLEGRVPASLLEGKIAIVGAATPDLDTQYSTAASPGRLMPGPEIQANALRTLLDGVPLRPAPWPLRSLVILLAAGVVLLPVRPRTTLLAFVAALPVLVVASQLLFGQGLLLSLTAPVAALVLATGASGLLAWRRQRSELDQLRRRFAEGDQSVIDDVLADPRGLGADQVIAGYTLTGQLGRGGMGVVYRADHEGLGREVAVKVIHDHLAQNAATRQRFVDEARAAARVEHPNVLPVYEAGEDHGLLYIAMRLVPGASLARYLAEHAPLPPGQAVQILEGLCAGAHAAHARGLVHRDIKPANVLIDDQSGLHPYLADFGLAEAAGARKSGPDSQRLEGTYDYLAPEQADGAAPHPSADIYALGCLLHEMLTGRPPYAGDTPAAKLWAHATQPAPDRYPASVPDSLRAVVAHALAKQPDRRYSTATALAEAARNALPQNSTTPSSTVPPRPAPSVTVDLDDDTPTVIR